MDTRECAQERGITPPSSLTCMIEPLAASVRRDPERLAVIDSEERLTYRELGERITAVSAVLRQRGVLPGQRIAYLLPNSWQQVVVYFALQNIGAVAVPLNFRSVAEELPVFCRTASVSALIYAPSREQLVAQASESIDDSVALWQVEALIAQSRACAGTLARDEECGLGELPGGYDRYAPSRIQFTGGSTGNPKAVVRTQLADLVEIEGTYLSNGLDRDRQKVVLIQCPIDHHGGHDWLCLSLAVGATVILEAGFDADRILHDISEFGVSYMILLPPTTYARLLEHPEIDRFDLSSLRVAQSSAGGMTRDIAASIFAHFPQAHICFGWGQTESGLGSSFVMTKDMLDADDPRVFSVGQPMPYIEMKIVDEAERELPAGVPGECVVRSQAVMTEYFGRDDLTQDAWTHDGWLKTGDIMSRDPEGYFYLRSRKKEMIKSGGENVFVGEVEAVIRAHPAVQDCVVFGLPDERFGESVGCAVELKAGAHLTLEELQEHCIRTIASYKKPRHMTIMASLNRDFSGKINRARIIEQCLPGGAAPRSFVREHGSPRVERVSTAPEIWQITIPLVSSVERSASCYLIRGDDTHGDLAIDVGENSDAAYAALREAWNVLGVDLSRLRVFLTHEHEDHWGALPRFQGEVGGTFAVEQCARILRHAQGSDDQRRIQARLRQEGFRAQSDADLFEVVERPVRKAALRYPVSPLHQGDLIQVGSERFEVWETGGHSRGQGALFHRESGILLSGDEVLPSVTTPVVYDGGERVMLDRYAAMLADFSSRGVRRILPGHGAVIEDPGARIAHIEAHHAERLAQIREIVAAGPVNGRVIAASIAWRIPVPWGELPSALRWITVSETFSYLDYAVEHGMIDRRIGDDATFTYST